MNKILLTLLQAALPQLIKLLTPEVIRKAADAALDVVEKAAASSENTIDDAVVLPVCRTIREAFNIPDDDAPPAALVGHA